MLSTVAKDCEVPDLEDEELRNQATAPDGGWIRRTTDLSGQESLATRPENLSSSVDLAVGELGSTMHDFWM